MFAEEGKEGDFRWLVVELKLLADVGLVGLPNAGKSTLISSISAARPKIADYPFTTLTPKLGVVSWKDFKGFVVADIPGLIQGAHTGKGLGFQFLRHVERTRLLLHLVDISEITESDPVKEFQSIRKEISLYSPEVGKKPFVVVATKADIQGSGEKGKRLENFCKRQGFSFFLISAPTQEGIQYLLDFVGERLSTLKGSQAEKHLEEKGQGIEKNIPFPI